MEESEREGYEGLEEPTEPPVEGVEGGAGAAGVVVVINASDEPAVVEDDGIERVDFDFIEQLMQTINELQLHPRVEGVDFELGPPVPPFALETMTHGLGMELPPVLRSLYEVVDGVQVTWSWRDDAGELVPGGQINICDFSTMFGTWFDVLWEHREDMSEAQLDALWSLRGFEDISAPSGRRQLAGVALDAERTREPELFFYERGLPMTRMLCGVVDYLYAMLAARGVYGWQLLLSEYDFAADPWGVGRGERFFEVMGTLFPEDALEVWRQRLGEGA